MVSSGNHTKMEKIIDLHSHTTASDGTFSPSQLVQAAVSKNLSALAVTDHDTVAGLPEAVKEAEKHGLELIKGIEITCDDPNNGVVDIHVLGLFIDETSEQLNELISVAKKNRIQQKKDIVAKLQSFGIKITYEEVQAISKGVPGRPQIAKVAIKNNPGLFNDLDDVFRQYLRPGKKAYVDRRQETRPKHAIEAIHSAGGLAFLAHPFVYESLPYDKMIRVFKDYGGDGIEVYYPHYIKSKYRQEDNPQLIEKLQFLVKGMGLMECGGNDFHGNPEYADLAKLKIPYSLLEKLKKAIQ